MSKKAFAGYIQLVLWTAFCLSPFSVRANPFGGQVVAGGASFQGGVGTLQINQSTDRAIINWQGFSIGANELTQFNQPSVSSAILNRVISGNPSEILGTLQANGQVYLINPNGILVGGGAIINTAGFTASTLDVGNEEFLGGGDLNFQGSSSASVVNHGKITALGGPVYLIARTVENHGDITASNGTVGLAGGTEILVKATGSERVFVQASSSAGSVVNKGQISAAVAELKASGGNIYALAINNEGVIRATGVVNEGGRILLKANKGTVYHKGQLVAQQGNKGGEIVVLGDRIAVLGSAVVDVSQAEGGGTVLIGGDYQGGNPSVANARQTYIGKNVVIDASATGQGNGGKVIVWADETTQFYGTIVATGGAQGGHGGFVETSGRDFLEAWGAVDASAPFGVAGTWLLDPRNVTITTLTSNGAFGGGSPNIFTPTGNGANANAATIVASLNGGTSVTITTGASGLQAGNITVASNIAKTGGVSATLTLQAANNIVVNSNITISSTSNALNVVFQADADGSGAGAITLNSGSQILSNGGDVLLSGGTTPATGFAAGNALNPQGIELNGATINAGTGNISLRGKSSGLVAVKGILLSNGAKLITTSGNISLTGESSSSFAGAIGIDLAGSTTAITTDSGAITLNGLSSSTSTVVNNIGVRVQSGAQVTATGSGDVTVQGTGGTTGLLAHGVWIDGTGSAISVMDGNLQVTGTATAGLVASDGILVSGGGTIGGTGTGNVTVRGVLQGAGSDPLSFGVAMLGAGSVIGGSSLSGDLLIVTDTAALLDGTVSGQGNLIFDTVTAGRGIEVGGTPATTVLNLSAANLDRLADGFMEIRVGATGDNDVVVNGGPTSGPFQDSVRLVAHDVTVNGALNSTDDINVDFGQNAAGLLNINAAVTGGGTVRGTGGASGDTVNIAASFGGTLRGQGGADTVFFFDGGAVVGNINGNGGNDTVSYQNVTSAVTVRSNDFTNVENIVGNAQAGTTLEGTGNDDLFAVTGSNAGTIGGVNFSQFANLDGRGGDDTFAFQNGAAAITGTITGGNGKNILDFSALAGQPVVQLVGLAEQGSVNSRVGAFATIDQIIGGGGGGRVLGTSGDDTFAFQGGNVVADSIKFIGFDEVRGGDGADIFNFNSGTWNGAVEGEGNADQFFFNGGDVTGLVQGNGGQDTFTFAAGTVNTTVQGDNGADTFLFVGGTVNGTLIGGDGSDQIDASTLGGVTVTLTGNANEGQFNGTLYQEIETFTGCLCSTLRGSTGNDTFDFDVAGVTAYGTLFENFGDVRGRQGADTFNFNDGFFASTVRGGGGADVFNLFDGSVQELRGGGGPDIFAFTGPGSVLGTVYGGGGMDLFTFISLTSGNLDDLGAQTFTLVGGGGADSIVMFDVFATTNQTFTITGGGMTRTGGLTAALSDWGAADILLLLAGAGDDTVITGFHPFNQLLNGGLQGIQDTLQLSVTGLAVPLPAGFLSSAGFGVIVYADFENVIVPTVAAGDDSGAALLAELIEDSSNRENESFRHSAKLLKKFRDGKVSGSGVNTKSGLKTWFSASNQN